MPIMWGKKPKVVWLTPHHVNCNPAMGHTPTKDCECNPYKYTRIQYDAESDRRYGVQVIEHRPVFFRPAPPPEGRS